MLLIGLIFLILGMLLVILTKSDYLNIFEIITDYFKIFNNNKRECIIFCLYPLFFSIGIVFLSDTIDKLYSELSVIVGIILSMLFAGLSILTTYDCSAITDEEQKEKFRMSIVQTINAIRFDFLMCLVLLIVIILIKIKFLYFKFIIDIKVIVSVLNIVLPIIVLYLFFVILFVLLLIIKNMFILIKFNTYIEKK